MLGTSKSVWGFDPRSVPGCQLWLDGADPAGTGTPPADGATVSTWVDKSGNGYNATAAPSRTAGTYSTSFRAVNFPNSTTGYITNYSAAPTNETMFVVFNNPTPSGNNNIIIGGVSGARSLGAGFTAAGTGTVGNLNTQVVWLASTGTYTAGTTVFTTSQFTPSSNSVSLNGGTFSTGGAPGFTAGRVTYLGVDATNPVYYYIGYAMEILFYNSVLTTTQRQTIETYLAKKWSIGSASTIPSTHPFYSIRPHLRVFRPNDIPGCQLWLDAADSSTITLSGTKVTQWNDKSGNGYNFTQATSGNQPTYSVASQNTQNAITFTAANSTYLVGTASTNFIGTNSLSMYGVFKTNNSTSGSSVFAKSIYGGGSGRILYGYRDPGTPGMIDFANSGGITHDVPDTYTPGAWRVVGFVSNRSGWTNITYQNGVVTATKTITADTTTNLTNAFPMLVGAYNNSSGGANPPQADRYLDGAVGELLIFNTALTTSQRQQIEGYLAHKWGLTGYYTPTTPVSIPGCQLWLDGADPAGTGTPPTDGTTVSTWNDKSGNGRNSPANSTGAIFAANSLNGNGALNFTAQGRYYVTPSFVPSSTNSPTIFLVAQQTGYTNGNSDIIGAIVGSPPWATFDIFGSGGTFIARLDMYNNQAENGSISIASPVIISIVGSGAPSYSVSMFANGTLNVTFTGDSGNPLSVSTGFNIGANAGFIGKIYEIIMYNTAFTTTQRQTIETYLAKKWGIGSTSFPSTHPFKSFPPASLYTVIALSATGGTVVSTGGITYHVFTSSSTLTVTGAGTINYLLVGGGGGGGDRHGGGGGAGGVVSGRWNASVGNYTVTVGAGGQYGATDEGGVTAYGFPNGCGTKGGDTSISGVNTAYGGGGGGSYDGNPDGTVGSGGGGGGTSLPGVAGTAGQGNSGGSGSFPGGGGGGGAGGVGANADTSTGGVGTSSYSSHLLAAGYGTTFAVPTSPNTVISGGVAYIAGGGGGASGSSPGPGGSGGLGGGGRGDWDAANITAGTPNTGGGGGATRSYDVTTTGRNGGSGLVLIWY
jgi:hypothetical protein